MSCTCAQSNNSIFSLYIRFQQQQKMIIKLLYFANRLGHVLTNEIWHRKWWWMGFVQWYITPDYHLGLRRSLSLSLSLGVTKNKRRRVLVTQFKMSPHWAIHHFASPYSASEIWLNVFAITVRDGWFRQRDWKSVTRRADGGCHHKSIKIISQDSLQIKVGQWKSGCEYVGLTKRMLDRNGRLEWANKS